MFIAFACLSIRMITMTCPLSTNYPKPPEITHKRYVSVVETRPTFADVTSLLQISLYTIV